jgi:hypothetical protein
VCLYTSPLDAKALQNEAVDLKTLWDRVAKTQKVELGSTSIPQLDTVEGENLVTPVVERKCVEMNNLLSALKTLSY